MIRGTIIGQVWATRRAAGLDGRKLVLVAARDAANAPTGRVVVAIDTLDADAGQDVTVAFGSGARNVVATTINRTLGGSFKSPADEFRRAEPAGTHATTKRTLGGSFKSPADEFRRAEPAGTHATTAGGPDNRDVLCDAAIAALVEGAE